MTAVVAGGGGGFTTGSVLVKPRDSVVRMSAVVSRPEVPTNSLNGSFGVRLLAGGLRKSEGSEARPQSASLFTPPSREKNAAGTGPTGGFACGLGSLPSNRRLPALVKRIRSSTETALPRLKG